MIGQLLIMFDKLKITEMPAMLFGEVTYLETVQFAYNAFEIFYNSTSWKSKNVKQFDEINKIILI